MPPRAGNWLELAVSDLPDATSKAQLFISVPKRFVPRAVDRNRVKRLIKEVLRREGLFADRKSYRLKVLRFSDDLNYEKAAHALRSLC